MDVDKLFKLPDLPSAAVSKRKWTAPKPDHPPSSSSVTPQSHPQAGPSDEVSTRPRKAARVDDEDDADAAPVAEEDETYFFSDDDQEDGRFFGGGLTAEQKRILDIMDAGDHTAGTASSSTDSTLVHDLPTLRKQLLRFERAINRNAEMRVKYVDNPARFIDSEVDLDAELKSLLVLTTQPGLFYREFVKLGGAASFVGLLSHENADIAAAAIEVIEELTDDDVVDQADAERDDDDDDDEHGREKGEAAAAMDELVEALLQQSLLDLLVSNLARFNDYLDPNLPPEEAATKAVEVEGDAQAIYHTLGALENLVSSRPALSERLVASTAFLPWLLSRLGAVRAVDQNTSYAAELLAILLQSSERNRTSLGTTQTGKDDESGIDVLLGVLARYRRRAPEGAEEQEFVENVFDSLCLVLSIAANKQLFVQAEGVELMVLLMKEKKGFGRVRAVKVLDHASSGPAASAVCTRIVQAGALAPLFSLFMQCNAPRNKNRLVVRLQDAEHLVGIFCSLLTHLDPNSIESIRLLSQFVTNNYQRLDHLLDLRTTLTTHLSQTQPHTHPNTDPDPDLDPELDSDKDYLTRLENGLFSLQLVDTTLAWICTQDDAARDHIQLLLHRNGSHLHHIAQTLHEYRDNIADQPSISTTTHTVPPHQDEVKTKQILSALIAYLESL